MTPNLSEIAPKTMAWAAELLVNSHGTFAPLFAAKAAEEMTDAGREDLACTWDVVRGLAERLIADTPDLAAAPLN